MPKVDLVVTACAGGLSSCDAKVACETRDKDPDSASAGDGSETPLPDYAPESFWLSKDAEYDWYDRNAFFERNESINSHSANLNPSVYPPLPPLHQASSSQRFLVNRKSRASLIRLPKTQKTAFAEAKNRKKGKLPGNSQKFTDRRGSTASKPDPAVTIEPGSPKVSCMGRVRSKRERNRRRRIRNKQAEPIRQSKDGEGLLGSFRAMFRERRRRRSGRKGDGALAAQSEEDSEKIVRDIRERLPASEAETPRSVVGGEAPSLGGMKWLASGRKPDTWAGDVA
ncbi:hypothetical protein MLD38_016010 [Melastoma candidum]|uniref:Uncharacterized protein n=1 Tax=Melastoma candidum TaxID=119954 RepID=A0ACB9RL35_9MYRT|nr:hypothetical protein MLD38_016010 [Melastoma candidum]